MIKENNVNILLKKALDTKTGVKIRMYVYEWGNPHLIRKEYKST